MSGKGQRVCNLPYLGDDVIFKIFVKCHPKTIGRLRVLSKQWNSRLRGKLFVRQNWLENEERDESIIIGYGYTPIDEKTHWCSAVDPWNGTENHLYLPIQPIEYGHFTVIGYDYSNLCLRYSTTGEKVELMVYNPTTKEVVKVQDQAYKYWGYSVSVYAFAYMPDQWECRIVYLFKQLYQDTTLTWLMWNSVDCLWNKFGEYTTEIQKVGPTSVVIEGVVYWIGWAGFFNLKPTHLIGFSVEDATFFEDEIPAKNLRSFHSITKIRQGLGFVSYQDVGQDREVNVWSLSPTEDKKFLWEKIIHIDSFGIPHSPNIFHGCDIVSILNTRSTSAGCNDDQRTKVVFSRRKSVRGSRSVVYHQGWQMSIFLKSYTMHRDGLYKILKDSAE